VCLAAGGSARGSAVAQAGLSTLLSRLHLGLNEVLNEVSQASFSTPESAILGRLERFLSLLGGPAPPAYRGLREPSAR
jgi:hypothetical protein